MRRWFRRKKEKEEEDLPPESVSPTPAEAEAVPEGEAQASGPEEGSLVPETSETPEIDAVSDQPFPSLEAETIPPAAEMPAELPPEPAAGEERRPGFFRRLFKGEAEEAPVSSPEAEGLPATGEPLEAVMPQAQEEPQTEAAPPEEEALEAEEHEALEEVPPSRRGLFKRFRDRLRRSREALAGGLDRLFLGRKEVDAALLEELEELLITADLGVETTLRLVEGLQDRLKRRELGDVEKLKEALAEEMLSLLGVPVPAPAAARPRVVLMVGVNGVGKTTTIAKLAHQERLQGRTPLLVAGDTFRAAAAEQLEIWGERIGAEVVRQKAGADPAAVVFDGLAAALARDVDTVFIDTAGRLHTKVNLMEELKKVYRTAAKKLPGAPHEVFLVLDATTGQNALSQARLFHEAVGITGIILTKMDGTAKGGVALAVAHETGLPLRYLGLGEGLEDLRPFDAEAYVAAILGG
ncbi:MAG: signal recognition particle-docking protein FtsY [Deltaproteobacteria bacterium]|nr:MAG: signal recognition particle-docking protein FtsY [Deltaproteobacteria bacterium]